MSSFRGIEISTRALQAFQTQLDVTGHNIANVGTAGYSRQTTTLKASAPDLLYQGTTLAMGSGVDATSVNRIRDGFLDARRLGIQGDASKVGQEQSGLKQVADVLQEPGDNGVSAAITKFYDAWSGLTSGTVTAGAQLQVQSAAQTLTFRVQGLYSSLKGQQDDLNSAAQQDLKDLQTKINSIGDLNKQIRDQQATGADANDLIDQRQQLLQDVSKLVNVTSVQNPSGTISVRMGQLTLVDDAGARTIPTKFDPTTSSISDANGTYPISSGKIAGEASTSQRIASYQSDLDKLANTLRTTVNSVYANATNAAGATGQKFFNDSSPQTGAADFGLDPGIANDASAIASGASGKPADGDIALQISQLRTTAQSALGGKSPVAFYSDLVNRIGQDAAYANSGNSTQAALLQQTDAQIQSVSGVSIDDEMANMVRFQRCYQAAAKALSMFDQTTQSLLAIIQ